MKIALLQEIEPEYDIAKLLAWYEEEKRYVRHRFGSDPEALMLWPNNYYERLELWWKSDRRFEQPITVIGNPNNYGIVDGWHRFAISHKFSILDIPIDFEY